MALVNRNIVALPHPSDPRQPLEIVGDRTKAAVIALTLALLLALAGAVGAAQPNAALPIGPIDPMTGEVVDRAPAPMTRDATERLLNGFITSLEAGAFSRYFAADAVLTRGECGEPAFGRNEVADAITGVCHGAFEGELTVNDAIVGAGFASVDGSVYARQVEPFSGVAPTGRLLVIPYAAHVELAGGQIVRVTLDISMDAIVKQLTWPDVAPPAPIQAGQPY
jgi:hypothetical protein